MPQKDDKISIYFGRVSPAVWDRIAEQPGATIDKAVAALARAIDDGQAFHYPSSRKDGISRTVWVMPETKETLDRLSQTTGQYISTIIRAALELYLGSPSGEASDQEPSQKASR